jgi:3',5'-cyclic-AMP phosphodiesterase
MPYLYTPNRRQFLAAAALGAQSLPAAEQQSHWAFLSDTHIAEDPRDAYRGFRPTENLQKVVPQVVDSRVQGALIDGDLARLEGKAGDYSKLKSLIEPVTAIMPVGLTLGNHDNRKNFQTAFRTDPGERHFVKNKYVLELNAGPVRLLLLDSLMKANVTPGFLGLAQRTWLETYLKAAPAKPTMIFFHHTLGDGDNDLLDAERLFRIIEPLRQVKAVVFGHSHVFRVQERDGIQLINLPAIGYNFADHAPVGWVEATLSRDGADLKLHAIGGNTDKHGTVTSLSWRG